MYVAGQTGNLNDAAEAGTVARVEALLEAEGGQTVNDGWNGDEHHRAPLHIAAFHGMVEVVELLLEWGATVNLKDKDGHIPLHWAAIGGHSKVAWILLQNEALVDEANFYGWTPLHAVAEGGDVGTALVLLDKGATLDMAQNSGWTPLHTAAHHGKREVVEVLLKKGAKKGLKNYEQGKKTPLDLAKEKGFQDIVALLENYE